ncbi:hypothetical protein AB0K35_28475 [Micromonospora sp. NPDC053740]|uniref:hypothetical protein n=1 Tax=Micromonospora sp. NPDC053740 TaxID=3155173 RepID=UPI0034264AF3
MTIQVDHISRTVDVSPRVLPGPSDEVAWTLPLVAALARTTPDEVAHTLAHPVPQWGCPYGSCAGAEVAYRDPSAELTWREDARVSPVRHEVTV